MAAVSHLKNKRDAKLREGIERVSKPQEGMRHFSVILNGSQSFRNIFFLSLMCLKLLGIFMKS